MVTAGRPAPGTAARRAGTADPKFAEHRLAEGRRGLEESLAVERDANAPYEAYRAGEPRPFRDSLDDERASRGSAGSLAGRKG
jgi:hypothetical protein